MMIWAHRGASADRPENTLSAFEEAVAQKADGVELDVMRCATGELVVCHDENLQRLAAVDWNVAETPWTRLAEVKINGQERIPLLEEVLHLLPKHLWVNIEIKCDRLRDSGLSVAVGDMVARLDKGRQTLISSFNPLNLMRLSSKHPTLRRGYLLDPARNHILHSQVIAPWVGNFSIHPHESVCRPARITSWHRRGSFVAVWTVDDVSRARELQSMGVNALITNQPGKMREALVVEAQSNIPT